MPKYFYKCNKCESSFQIWHGMKEVQEACQICNQTNCLTRIPQQTFIPKVTVEDQKIGKVTKEYISENAELLKEMKKEARSQVYED